MVLKGQDKMDVVNMYFLQKIAALWLQLSVTYISKLYYQKIPTISPKDAPSQYNQ